VEVGSGALGREAREVSWEALEGPDPRSGQASGEADLWGDHAKGGAFGALFKLPAGSAAPLHTHTHDMKVVIVSGTYIQAPAGKPEFRLEPGSYFMQPGGDYRHTTTCDKGSDCVFLVESGGKFDLKPVQPAKSAETEPAKK
jgi:quercetin dioxygenase-like cupin family protein